MERRTISTTRPSGVVIASKAIATSPELSAKKGALGAPAASPRLSLSDRRWQGPRAKGADFYRYRTDPFAGDQELFRGNDYY
jgi:hypothetical protein